MSIARLDLRNSGDTAGPRDRVVGYGSWALFEPAGRQPAAEQAGNEEVVAAVRSTLVELACASIAHGLSAGCPKPVAATVEMPAILAAPGAVFVTLHRDGQLRGCVGSPLARRPLVADVAENAFKAALKDPRFPPLQAHELDGLDLSIALLTPPVRLYFADESELLAQLRPAIDGLIIEDGAHRALFLPAMWRQLPDRRQFLNQLKHKAGLTAEYWSPAFNANRFQTMEIEHEPVNVLRMLLALAARSMSGFPCEWVAGPGCRALHHPRACQGCRGCGNRRLAGGRGGRRRERLGFTCLRSSFRLGTASPGRKVPAAPGQIKRLPSPGLAARSRFAQGIFAKTTVVGETRRLPPG